MSELLSVIEVVEVVERTWQAAKKRIPDHLRGKITFFSDWDLWRYKAIMDDVTCLDCKNWTNALIPGSKIRLLFPYLEIIDEFTIRSRTHMPRDDNCRCKMLRTG